MIADIVEVKGIGKAMLLPLREDLITEQDQVYLERVVNYLDEHESSPSWDDLMELFEVDCISKARDILTHMQTAGLMGIMPHAEKPCVIVRPID